MIPMIKSTNRKDFTMASGPMKNSTEKDNFFLKMARITKVHSEMELQRAKAVISLITDASMRVKSKIMKQVVRVLTLTLFKNISILANGLKTNLMVMRNKNSQMVPIMKASLLKELNKAMVIMFVNQEFIKDNLNQEISMGKAHSIIQIIGFTKGNGSMDCFQDTESSVGQTEIVIKDNTKTG